jgi:hypothetical protein
MHSQVLQTAPTVWNARRAPAEDGFAQQKQECGDKKATKEARKASTTTIPHFFLSLLGEAADEAATRCSGTRVPHPNIY